MGVRGEIFLSPAPRDPSNLGQYFHWRWKWGGEMANELGGNSWLPAHPFLKVPEKRTPAIWRRKPRKRKTWVPGNEESILGLGPFKNLGTYGVRPYGRDLWQGLMAAPAVLLCKGPLAYSDTGNSTGGSSFLPNPGKEGHHKGPLSNNTCSSFS